MGRGDPLIIEAAINGATKKDRNPNAPISPEEVAADALACLDAGASIVHSHTEDFSLTGDAAAVPYLAAYRAIRKVRPDAILCPTSTSTTRTEDRNIHDEILAAEGVVRMGVLDPGTISLASTRSDGTPLRFVLLNTYDAIDHTVEVLARIKLGPSMGIYDPTFLRAALAYHRAGRLPQGALLKFYFGGGYDFHGHPNGVSFGMPPTEKALDIYLDMMAGCDLPWSVAVLGGDVIESGMARYAAERGGHIRVGLEDYAGFNTPANTDLVRAAVAVAHATGRSVADCKIAARILNLPRPV